MSFCKEKHDDIIKSVDVQMINLLKVTRIL